MTTHASKFVNISELQKFVGATENVDSGFIVNTMSQYPNGTPVYVAVVMSNGKIRVTDYGKGIETIIRNIPTTVSRPGYYFGKAARNNNVRYREGEIYQLLPKKSNISTLINAIRAVSTATQNGVVMTPNKYFKKIKNT